MHILLYDFERASDDFIVADMQAVVNIFSSLFCVQCCFTAQRKQYVGKPL